MTAIRSLPATVAAALLLILLPGTTPAVPSYVPAQRVAARIALVIGNSSYEGGSWAPLTNPVNDARDMAGSLRSLRFRVMGCGEAGPCLDATRPMMESAIRDFVKAL
jgi:hypothetical protein